MLTLEERYNKIVLRDNYTYGSTEYLNFCLFSDLNITNMAELSFVITILERNKIYTLHDQPKNIIFYYEKYTELRENLINILKTVIENQLKIYIIIDYFSFTVFGCSEDLSYIKLITR